MSSPKQLIFSAANLWVRNETARNIAEYAAKYLDVNGYDIVSREANTVTVSADDLRTVLRDGIDWTDDHGPTVRLADAVNATVLTQGTA